MDLRFNTLDKILEAYQYLLYDRDKILKKQDDLRKQLIKIWLKIWIRSQFDFDYIFKILVRTVY